MAVQHRLTTCVLWNTLHKVEIPEVEAYVRQGVFIQHCYHALHKSSRTSKGSSVTLDQGTIWSSTLSNTGQSDACQSLWDGTKRQAPISIICSQNLILGISVSRDCILSIKAQSQNRDRLVQVLYAHLGMLRNCSPRGFAKVVKGVLCKAYLCFPALAQGGWGQALLRWNNVGYLHQQSSTVQQNATSSTFTQ